MAPASEVTLVLLEESIDRLGPAGSARTPLGHPVNVTTTANRTDAIATARDVDRLGALTWTVELLVWFVIAPRRVWASIA